MVSWQKTFLISFALAGLIGLAILVISLRSHSSCDGIFEQTAPKIEAHLEVIKNKGTVVVSQEKIQELSNSTQKVGLHLKTCCKVLDRGKLDAAQFEQCIDKASAYGKQIELIVQDVIEAVEMKEESNLDVQPEKIADINKSFLAATSNAENFSRQVENINSQGEGSQEKESNDQITSGNQIILGTRVQGAIASEKDRDYFLFRTSGRETNGTRVILRKLSSGGFHAEVHVYDQVERHIIGRRESRDHPVSFVFNSAPNSDYYILVRPFTGQGPYELEVREE